MLTATFQPQQWVNDYAIDSGPAQEFDAGAALLQLGVHIFRYVVYQAHACSGRDLDALASAAGLVGSGPEQHSGPFRVDLDKDDLDAFLDSVGITDVTTVQEEDLAPLRTAAPAQAMRP